MPTVTPPPSVTSAPVAPASTPAGVTPVEANIGNAPDRIQQLTHQIQVTGQITQPPDGSEITLNTVLGNLTILLPLLTKDQQDKLTQQLIELFQNQKPLTVVIQPGNPPAQAFLLLPPPAPTTNAAQSTFAQTNILSQAITSSASPIASGQILPAVVLQPNTTLAPSPVPLSPFGLQPFPNAPLAALPDQLLLEELVVKAEAFANQIIPEAQAEISVGTPLAPPGFIPFPLQTVPAASTPQTPAAAFPQLTPLPQTPVVPGLNPPTLPGSLPALNEPVLPQSVALQIAPQITANAPAAIPLSSLFQPGTEISLRVDAVALPGAPPPVASLPDQIVVTVTGNGPNGQLLVQSGNTALYVKQSVDAPVGSTLLVTVGPGRPEALTPLLLPDAGSFNTLQQALTALAQVDPQLARQVMESVVPQPSAALGGALLFFLSALGQGNLSGWLGNNAVDVLTRAGKVELIAKLMQELSESGTTVNDPIVGAWRSYTVPLHADNQFHALHLYVHGDARGYGGKEKGSSKSATAVRFLIDMRLSKLGAMQLDGFVRPKQLDMIVRSENVLPEGLNHDLRQTYIKALEAVNYAGSLNFQIGRQNWLALRKPGAGSRVM